MNAENIILYLKPWIDIYNNDEVKISDVVKLSDGVYQDGIRIKFKHTSDNICRYLDLYTDLDIDKDGLAMGKLNGFVTKCDNESETNTSDTPKYQIEILRTYLKKEINVSFEYPYDTKPGIWINIEKKHESLYRAYSLEYKKNTNNEYIGVKIIFNSLKYKTTYPEINIIVIGDEIKDKEDNKNETANAKEVNINNIDIKIAADLDDLTQQVNSISPNTGITVNNVIFPIDGYKISINEISTNLECGKVIDNLYLFTKQNLDESILVCDFTDVETVSENFCKSWTKLLLQTKCKIIPINMNPMVSKTLSLFVESNITEITE